MRGLGCLCFFDFFDFFDPPLNTRHAHVVRRGRLAIAETARRHGLDHRTDGVSLGRVGGNGLASDRLALALGAVHARFHPFAIQVGFRVLVFVTGALRIRSHVLSVRKVTPRSRSVTAGPRMPVCVRGPVTKLRDFDRLSLSQIPHPDKSRRGKG